MTAEELQRYEQVSTSTDRRRMPWRVAELKQSERDRDEALAGRLPAPREEP